MVIDWENHRYYNGVKCIFTPRETWEGNGLKPGAKELIGTEMFLSTAWLMDDDKYPGEYALEGADQRTVDMLHELEATWVASGDVTVVEVTNEEK